MKNKNNVYVEVESKEQAETYRKVLEAMGEPISDIFWLGYSEINKSHTNLSFCLRGNWTMGAVLKGEKITFGELIDLLQRKPLLISKDGVELFEGDFYHRIFNENFNWFYKGEFTELNSDSFVITNPHEFKAFSTKKAAIEWIESQKSKAYEVKLFGGKTANIHKDLIRIFDGNNTMNIMPSDLEDLSHSFSLYFGKDFRNG